MKKLKLRSWVKETILIVGITTIIFSAIKIHGMKMGQQKNDLLTLNKVVLVKKLTR